MPREEKSIPGSKHGLCKGPGAVHGGGGGAMCLTTSESGHRGMAGGVDREVKGTNNTRLAPLLMRVHSRAS